MSCHHTSSKTKFVFNNDDRPWTIAHRGASYHLPEHTLPAYRLAWELNADYIEPDLVVSSDGILLAMHSVDLTVTSNVEEKYNNESSGNNRQQWYSPTQNRSSYWSFNFTAAELSELGLRQRLPEQRSIDFDYLFGMPKLRDVANNLVEWNTQLLGRQQQRPAAGLYVELKDSDWILQDSGIDIVELLYREITKGGGGGLQQEANDNPWDTILSQGHYLCNGTNISTTAHDVPGLIIQSFNANDLERFHAFWQADTTNLAPEPPYVLLVDENLCTLDQFWFQVGLHYRSFISGIGCAVSCLDHFAVRERLKEYNLVAHPWTIRPEDVPDRFSSLQDQVDYLMCNTSGVVKAIFIETPEVRLTKFSDCPSTKPVRYIPPSEINNTTSSGVVAASFLLGAAITALLMNFKSICMASKRHDAIPTSEPSNSLELT